MDTGAYILIGMLILGAAAAVGIGVGIYKIRKKIREISQTAFGTDSFIEGYKRQESELANAPRSVNGMTKLLLPSITRDFEEFRYEEVKSKSEALVRAYLNAIEKQDISKLKTHQISQQIIDKVNEIIDDMNSQNMKMYYNNIVIHRTEISDYKKSGGLCTVNLQSSVGFINYCLDSKEKVVNGRKDMNRQTVFETSYTYIQDSNKLQESGNYSSVSLSCPHCGAPIKNLGSKFCEYCGSGVKEINIYSWRFTDIREIDKKANKIF